MLDLEQHPASDKSSSHHSTDAARYSDSYPYTAPHKIAEYAYRKRLPGRWMHVICNRTAKEHVELHHVGYISGARSVCEAYAIGVSYCVNHNTYGNIDVFDLRQALYHRGKNSWAQVTRIIDRMLACKVIRRAPGVPHIFQLCFYNDHPLKRQRVRYSIAHGPVSNRNNQVLNSSMNSTEYEDVRCLLDASDAQAYEAGLLGSASPPCEGSLCSEFKKSPPKSSPTPPDGIGPSILPVANQGLESSPKAKHAVIISEPLTALPSPKIEKAPESALRASFARLPFLDDTQALLERIRARDAEDVAFDVYTPSQSEAASRGFSVVNQEQERKRAEAYRPKAKLVPVRETAASFCFAPTQGRQRSSAGQSSAHDRAGRREPT